MGYGWRLCDTSVRAAAKVAKWYEPTNPESSEQFLSERKQSDLILDHTMRPGSFCLLCFLILDCTCWQVQVRDIRASRPLIVLRTQKTQKLPEGRLAAKIVVSRWSLSLYLSIYIISVPEYPKGTCFKSAEFGWTVGHKGYAWCILIHWVMQHASPFWKAGWTSHRRIFCLPSWEAIGIYLTTDHIKICIRIITVFIIH